MLNTSNTQIRRSTSAANPSLTARIARCVTAIAFCALFSSAIAPASVRACAAKVMDTYTAGQSYIRYTPDHIPSADGTIEDVTQAIAVGEDHTYDLYGNEIVFNSDNTISDANDQVVGFVYVGAGGPDEPAP